LDVYALAEKYFAARNKTLLLSNHKHRGAVIKNKPKPKEKPKEKPKDYKPKKQRAVINHAGPVSEVIKCGDDISSQNQNPKTPTPTPKPHFQIVNTEGIRMPFCVVFSSRFDRLDLEVL
jgi:hypothetical protein